MLLKSTEKLVRREQQLSGISSQAA